MSQKVNLLQEYEPRDWSGLTTSNHIGAIFGSNVQDAMAFTTMMYQVNYGMDLDAFLSRFEPLYLDTDDDFRWRLQGHYDKNISLVGAFINGVAIAPADTAGLNNSLFTLRFTEPYFKAGAMIAGERNEVYPIRIVNGPVSVGSYYDYDCQLFTGDQNLFIPYDELTSGKRFSGEWYPVEKTMSKMGDQVHYSSPFAMRNTFSMIRIEDKRPGNMIARPVAFDWIVNEGKDKGKQLSTWMQYADWELYRQFRDAKNRLLMFANTNKADDGSFRQMGFSNFAIEQGAGIRQQMSPSNTIHYNTFDIDWFTDALLDLSVGKIREDRREMMVRTGEWGLVQFHRSMEAYGKTWTPAFDTNRIYMKSDGTMGFKGQFFEYIAPNGIKVTVEKESLYDDHVRNKILHPSGKGLAESYTYDIFSVGTIDGKDNIRKVYQKGSEMIMGYQLGFRNPFTADLKKNNIISTPEDAYSIHLGTVCGAMITDPTKTARFVHNSLAV